MDGRGRDRPRRADARIAASLFARFASRQDDTPAMKAVAAMRNQFGGHAVKPEAARGDAGRQPGTRPHLYLPT